MFFDPKFALLFINSPIWTLVLQAFINLHFDSLDLAKLYNEFDQNLVINITNPLDSVTLNQCWFATQFKSTNFY